VLKSQKLEIGLFFLRKCQTNILEKDAEQSRKIVKKVGFAIQAWKMRNVIVKKKQP